MAIVEIRNLKREFNMGGETVKALNDISFTIDAGEFITIILGFVTKYS